MVQLSLVSSFMVILLILLLVLVISIELWLGCRLLCFSFLMQSVVVRLVVLRIIVLCRFRFCGCLIIQVVGMWMYWLKLLVVFMFRLQLVMIILLLVVNLVIEDLVIILVVSMLGVCGYLWVILWLLLVDSVFLQFSEEYCMWISMLFVGRLLVLCLIICVL